MAADSTYGASRFRRGGPVDVFASGVVGDHRCSVRAHTGHLDKSRQPIAVPASAPDRAESVRAGWNEPAITRNCGSVDGSARPNCHHLRRTVSATNPACLS